MSQMSMVDISIIYHIIIPGCNTGRVVRGKPGGRKIVLCWTCLDFGLACGVKIS